MLDRRTSALLQTINDFCASGTYKVFSEEDFLSAFPEGWGVTAESLSQMLVYLSENRLHKHQVFGRRHVLCLSASARAELLRAGGGEKGRKLGSASVFYGRRLFRFVCGRGSGRARVCPDRTAALRAVTAGEAGEEGVC